MSYVPHGKLPISLAQHKAIQSHRAAGPIVKDVELHRRGHGSHRMNIEFDESACLKHRNCIDEQES